MPEQRIATPNLVIRVLWGSITLLCLVLGQAGHAAAAEHTGGGAQLAIDKPASADERTEKLGVYIDMIDELSGLIDPSSYDTPALLDHLDYDASSIASFVREDIRYEQYPGILRGAEATLRGRAGNAADQSLLLASLLRDAGYDARIVSAAQAPRREVLDAAARPENAGSGPTLEAGEIFGVVDAYSDRLGIDPASVKRIRASIDAAPEVGQTQEAADTGVVTEALLAALSDSGVQPSAPEPPTAVPYYWVQYREAAASPWQDAHPVALSQDVAANLTPGEIFADALPEALLHRVGIEVVVEQDVNGKRRAKSLASPWIRPAANVSDLLLDFQVVPMSVARADAAALLDTDQEPGTEIFVVVFNGSTLPNAFDTAGNVIPTDAAGSAYAALFATASDKLNQVAGALGQVGQTETDGNRRAATLAGVKLIFSFLSPEGTEQRFERLVFDRGMADGSAGEGPLSTRQLAMLTREFSFRYATTEQTDLETVRLRLAQARAAAQQSIAQINQQAPPRAPVQWSKAVQLYNVFDSAEFAPLTYRDSPNLIVHYQTSGLEEEWQEGVDIVRNARRPRQASAGPEELVRQGVWESLTEGSVLSEPRRTSEPGSTFRIIRSPSDLDRLRSRFDDLGLRHARADIERGAALAIRQQDLDAAQRAPIESWWRIAPSGQTLRMLSVGTGGEETEYLTQAEVAKAVTCVSAVTAGCRAGTTWASASAVLKFAGKNQKAIDALLTIGNTLSGMTTGVAIELPPEADFGGTTQTAAGLFEAARHQVYKACLRYRLPSCAKP